MRDTSRRAYDADASYESDWNRAVNGSDSPAAAPRRRPGAKPGVYPQATYRPARTQAGQAAGIPGQGAPGGPYAAAQQPASKPRGRRKPGGCYVFLSWVALLCWAAFIYYMSAHTSSQLGQGIFAHVREVIEQLVWTYYGYVEDPVSPIGHFCEYFIFGALLGNALHCHMPLLPATFLAIACASGYGYTDEIHQLSVAGRYFDLEDWKVDTIAATLGSFLASTVFYLFAKRPR